jgi:hypothetical protein
MTFTPDWLALREPADHRARAADLVDLVRVRWESRDPAGGARRVALNRTRVVVRDLGCGTGSMGRWLAARLDRPQHWVLHDRDPRLLTLAEASMTGAGGGVAVGDLADATGAGAGAAADGPGVTVETRLGDLTALTAGDLAGTSLVTASALLDLLTEDEVTGLARACVTAGCPALFTLSVAGRAELDPADPLDDEVQAAFNDHQRRVVAGRRLLGPDAVDAAADAFRALGAEVHTRPSPWRLGPEEAALTREWLRGWVDAAVAQNPDLATPAADLLRRRLTAPPRVVLHHTDLLALP